MTISRWALAAAALLPLPLAAQSLRERIASAGDGIVLLSFAAREGVCAGGRGIILNHDHEDEWESDCDRQPVRVSLQMLGGRVASADTHVGGRWRAGREATDLGLVPAGEAADVLLALAPRAAGGGEELVTAAALADSAETWPHLLQLARNEAVPEDTRRQAVFWLSQAAGQEATRGLDSLATDPHGDLEIREHAVFALSQRPADEGVPALIRIARSNPSPELRKKALFWLGQSDDPRALALFEELLR